MSIDLVSRPVIDRMLQNLLCVREMLEQVDTDPARANVNVPVYIICRERMRMVKEDMRHLRTALNIDDILTAMGVHE